MVRVGDALDIQGGLGPGSPHRLSPALRSHWGEFQVLPRHGGTAPREDRCPRRYPVEQASQDVLDVHSGTWPFRRAWRQGWLISLVATSPSARSPGRPAEGVARPSADHHAEDVPCLLRLRAARECSRRPRDRSQVKLPGWTTRPPWCPWETQAVTPRSVREELMSMKRRFAVPGHGRMPPGPGTRLTSPAAELGLTLTEADAQAPAR